MLSVEVPQDRNYQNRMAVEENTGVHRLNDAFLVGDLLTQLHHSSVYHAECQRSFLENGL